MHVPRLLLPCLLLLQSALRAQAPAPPAYTDDDAIVAKITAACRELLATKALHEVQELRRAGAARRQCELEPAPLRTADLAPPDVHDLVSRSVLIVGAFYLCKECNDWHFNGSSGFAIGDHQAVTCWHVLADDPDMKTAYLVAADTAGHVWPVRSVLAADTKGDVCVLDLDAKGLVPLPLTTDARVGERLWCLSHPDHHFGYFSEGMLARRMLWREPPPDDGKPARPGAPGQTPHAPPPQPAAADPGVPTLAVTTPFAKGSSGAPVVDARGNVVGVAQSTLTIVWDDDAAKPDTQMVIRYATPAALVLDLLRAPKPK
jgi:serine protease Do